MSWQEPQSEALFPTEQVGSRTDQTPIVWPLPQHKIQELDDSQLKALGLLPREFNGPFEIIRGKKGVENRIRQLETLGSLKISKTEPSQPEQSTYTT